MYKLIHIFVVMLLDSVYGNWSVDIVQDEVLVGRVHEQWNCSIQFPKISIHGTKLLITHVPPFKTTNFNKSVDIHITNPTLRLICSAPYPLEWVFDEYPRVTDNMREWNINMTRYVEDISNISTYRFETELYFRFRPPLQIPQVACRAAMEYKNLQITVTQEYHNSYLRLIFQPTLDSTQKPIAPRYGQNPNCRISLTYNELTNQICCLTPNTTFFTRGCSDPPSCQGFFAKTNCPYFSTSEKIESENCLDSIHDLAKFGNGGIVVCKSAITGFEPDTESAVLHYYTNVLSLCGNKNHKPKIYIDQEYKAHPKNGDELMDVCEPPNNPIYVGESVQFFCHVSYYYYSMGILWILKGENGKSIQILPPDEELIQSSPYIPESNIIKTVLTASIWIQFNNTVTNQIVCNSPIWDAYAWNTKGIPVKVIEPKAVKFVGGFSNSIIELKPYEIINCTAIGDPVPILSWSYLPTEVDVIRNDSPDWIALRLPNNTTDMTDFKIRCKAQQNRIHKLVMKKFIISKSIPSSSNGIGATYPIITTAVLLGVCLVASIFLWRKLQIMKRLREINVEEYYKFFRGNKYGSLDEVGNHSSIRKAISRKFDRAYEIKESLIIGKVIGIGNFSIVRAGILKIPNNSGESKFRKVAVKSMKAFSDISIFKSSLAEIKLMIYIGHHENILELIGAQTKGFYQRLVYTVTEFCENGNLGNYLRKNRDILVQDMVERRRESKESSKYASKRTDSTKLGIPSNYVRWEDFNLSADILEKWSLQIASGMEFLGYKKVIHGDLAARNVFLTGDLTVKIGDFGLSHQLTETYIYILEHQPLKLPWKWLAPECFSKLEFSIQSDIWAYGVTLWEIYSLGDIPLTDRPYLKPFDYLERLNNGFRLGKPFFVSQKIYTKMKQCWQQQPLERPTFASLKQFFINFGSTDSDDEVTENATELQESESEESCL